VEIVANLETRVTLFRWVCNVWCVRRRFLTVEFLFHYPCKARDAPSVTGAGFLGNNHSFISPYSSITGLRGWTIALTLRPEEERSYPWTGRWLVKVLPCIFFRRTIVNVHKIIIERLPVSVSSPTNSEDASNTALLWVRIAICNYILGPNGVPPLDPLLRLSKSVSEVSLMWIMNEWKITVTCWCKESGLARRRSSL
jgi:hypothetical protein